MGNSNMMEQLRLLFNDRIEKLYLNSDVEWIDGACPFMPFIGDLYENEATTRVMIIGKATYGWGYEKFGLESLSDAFKEKADYDRLNELTNHFVHNEIIPYYGGHCGYHSQFFNVLYRSLGAVLDRDSTYIRNEEQANRRFQSVVWTNIFKIGRQDGNPDKNLLNLNLDFFDTLSNEIEILKPHIILLPTGHGYDQYLSQMLGIDVSLASDSFFEFHYNGANAIRTRHYMGMKIDLINQLLEKVISISNKK